MKKEATSQTSKKKEEGEVDKTNGKFLITGIGASAGGVEALTTFFEHVPSNSGIAYVVILHLSPDHDSQLAEILGNVTSVPVLQVKEKVLVRPDHIYVISPNVHLEMEDGHIAVSPNLTTEDRRAPVDIFFRTLAESHKSMAVGVILSGTGANGSMGIKRIKEQGGAAYAQDPQEARFNEMPRNAIATHLIDEILSVAKIPSCIIAYKQSLGKVAIPEIALEKPEESQQALRSIFTQLRVRTGHDFSNYKRPTLLRRIERRMNIRNIDNLISYAEFISEHPEESHSLLKDLLISVTNFFRDKKPFETLERDILPRIFQGKTGLHKVRIWVSGCATGEEAYSLAMLCAERIQSMIDAPKVQIFATDIDESAIALAREGLYSLNDAADVSPERLQRFFTMEGDQYLVRREIREMIIFAPHNVLKDPPFSHLDLASCRNMLIYLNSTAQERVMETLHFALNPGGFLFLGTSESVDGSSDMYSIVSREDHIYQSQSIGRRHIPLSEPALIHKIESKHRVNIRQSKDVVDPDRITYGELHQQLLEQYAPPSIVVNAEYDILHLSDRAGRYLQVVGGELSRNLLKLIRPELRLELRTLFYQATQRNMPTEARNLEVTIDEKTETIKIQVRPVVQEGDAAQGFMLVLFEQNHEGAIEEKAYTSDESLAHQLEEELIRVKGQLRASSDQYEVQAEELKATNEELQAMNEELRSAAEELETSKEELQSINEELRTVNQELKVKIEEVSLTSNNLQNLINSANIGTIFLDRSFRVMLYTPAALQIFNLIPADYSRALSDITNRLKEDSLIEDAQTVLDKLSVIEREMKLNDGRVFFVRYSPYRTEEDRIQGVVITFLEITARKRAEESLRRTHERMQQAMDVGKIFSWEMNPENRQLEWSENMEEVIGFQLFNTMDKTFQLFHHDDYEYTANAINNSLKTGEPYASEYRLINPVTGEESWFSSSGALMQDKADGKPRFVGITQNISDRKKASEAVKNSEEKFRTLFNSIDEGFYLIEVQWDENNTVTDLFYLDENPAAIAMIGQRAKGRFMSELNPDYEQHWRESFGQTAKTGKSKRLEAYAGPNDSWFDYYVFKPEGIPDDRTVAVVFRDVTQRKRTDEALRQSVAWAAFRVELNDAVRDLTDPIKIRAISTQIVQQHLRVDRVIYSELGPAGLFNLMGENADRSAKTSSEPYLQSAFEIAKETLQEGKSFISTNIAEDENITTEKKVAIKAAGFNSCIIVPLIKKGSWAANLALFKIGAHDWTTYEIQLTQESAERIWAAVSRSVSEQSLRESEERLQLAVSSANIFTWEMNLDTQETISSANFTDVIGFQAEPGTALNFSNIHPEDEAMLAKAMQQTERGSQLDIEHRVIDPVTQDIIWVRVQGRLIDGSPKRIIGITQNITSRRLNDQALKESETRFRTLTDVVPQIIWANDSNGVASYFNERWYNYSGLNYEQSVGLGWEANVHPNDAPASVERWQAALTAGETFDSEYRLRDRNGNYRWFIGRNVPLRNDLGNVIGWFGSATDIDELKQVQEALHESRERLKVTVDSAREFAIITFDTNGNIQGWNSGAARIFEFTEEEMIGKPGDIIFTPEDRAAGIPEKEFRDAREKGRAEDERWHLRSTGERVYMSGIMAPIYDVALTGYVKVARDMTRQRQAEEQLAISEERYRVALQSAEMGAWDWNIRDDKTQWNDQHFRLLGLEPQDGMLSTGFLLDFVHPDDLEAVNAEYASALQTGLYEMETFRIVKADSSVRWMSGYGRVIDWDNADPLRMVGVMYDITERVASEQALRDKQLQLEIAQRAARVGIWGFDLKNKQGIATPELLELTGYPFEGETWDMDIFLQMVHTDDRSELRNAYLRAASEHSSIEHEFRMEHPVRGVQWMLMRGQYIPPYDKMNATLMGSLIDITERRIFEEQKDAFIGIASHELRTPVTSIKAYAEVLEEMFSEAGDNSSAELMRKLDGQVDRLTGLIHALLDTTTIVAGQMQLQLSTFDIEKLIEETVDSFTRTSKTHRIEINFSASVEVYADKERIRQVILNLIGNAIKYSPKADRIVIYTITDEDQVTVCVQDWGIGISDEVQQRIFDRFYRSGDAETSTFSGLGLGLFISAGIVHNHKGKITVNSKKGEGSLFCFSLPLPLEN